MNRIAGRAGIVLILALVLLGGSLFFVGEYVAKGSQWATFTGSPHVYNGNNIGCGVITDREGTVLLDMTGSRTYTADSLLRKSTLHWLGDRDGYISAPALAYHANAMAGFDTVNGVYSFGEGESRAELTLSASVQKVALEAMGSFHGTVAVYNYKTGEILCAVTTPTYDPDQVPDIAGDTTGAYDGAYLNRFVQSSYIPGSIFKTVTLAAALEEIPDIESRTFSCSGSYPVEGDLITCETAHGEMDLRHAFAKSCNCAFAQLTEELGGEALEKWVKKFGITEAVTFDGVTTESGNFDIDGAAMSSICWSAIGQHRDLINPCAFMGWMGTIAGGGKTSQPHLVSSVQVGKDVTYRAKHASGSRVLSAATAEKLRDYMGYNVEYKYGAENFPGLTVCAKSGTAEMDGDQAANAMFAGFVSDPEYPLAFIIAVENGGYGATACIPILSKVLGACKDVLDAW